MIPRYPVYIPSYRRHETPLTIKTLEEMGVRYSLVVEEDQVDQYEAISNPSLRTTIVLPFTGRGLVPTRNFIWDHALKSGAPRFWTFDDNISCFYRVNNNRRIRVISPAPLCALEDFVDRYENVPVAGFQYAMFAFDRTAYPPFVVNRRVYSNMLIQSDACDPSGEPYRNRGVYNDDTDLCLRIMTDGLCTILFNAFLVQKKATMTVKGGMTGLYEGDGRYKMAKELQARFPEITGIVRRWGRWQHSVDYRRFKGNRLIKKKGLTIQKGTNNYGMVLKALEEGSP